MTLVATLPIYIYKYIYIYFLTHTRRQLRNTTLLIELEGPLEITHGPAWLVVCNPSWVVVARITTDSTEDGVSFIELMAYQTTMTRSFVFCDVFALLFNCNHNKKTRDVAIILVPQHPLSSYNHLFTFYPDGQWCGYYPKTLAYFVKILALIWRSDTPRSNKWQWFGIKLGSQCESLGYKWHALLCW